MRCRAGARLAAISVPLLGPARRSSVARCSASGTRESAGAWSRRAKHPSRRQALRTKIFRFTEIRNYGISRTSPARRRGAVRESFESRVGLRWTRQRRHEMGRAGRVVPVSPGPACERTALLSSSRQHSCSACAHCGKTLWRQANARTAKPCRPGRRCYGQATAKMRASPTRQTASSIRGAREARRKSAPGRARHKPSDHRAGKAVCSASPVCRCAFSMRFMRTADRGCQSAPGLPCALCFWGREMKQSSGEISREDAQVCLRLHTPCHRPARPSDPVFQRRIGRAEKLRLTGCPGQAGA